MTVLRQLKRDLQDAAERTLSADSVPIDAPTHRHQVRPQGRGFVHQGASKGVVALSVSVSIAVLVVALLSVYSGHGGRRVGGPPTAGLAPKQITNFRGTSAACRLALSNTPTVGEVAPRAADELRFEITALDRGVVAWPKARVVSTFHTCPPARALLVGDSTAFTLGLPYLANEQDYGMAIANTALLGCSFGTRGQLDVNGTWTAPPSACSDELNTWAAEADAFGANEIIVELGYRDEFDWRWNGKLEHLGDAAYDGYIERRVQKFVRVLGQRGKRKLLFLSVPDTEPSAQPNGHPAPQATAIRHQKINDLVAEGIRGDAANAEVLDIDRFLSPDGRYAADINGRPCRFGGVHVTVYCSAVLEPHILQSARELLTR
jgi:hypothetical protein